MLSHQSMAVAMVVYMFSPRGRFLKLSVPAAVFTFMFRMSMAVFATAVTMPAVVMIIHVPFVASIDREWSSRLLLHALHDVSRLFEYRVKLQLGF